MISASQIKNELAFYLAGVLSLDNFEDWFVLQTWNVSNAGSRAAEVVTFEIEEKLSEYSSGYISEKRLREELSNIVQAETKSVKILNLPPVVLPRHSIMYFTGSAELPVSAVQARRQAVCA